ncbi:MAG: hypothetical protein R2838_01680 [Caldilineaceae bacterium]
MRNDTQHAMQIVTLLHEWQNTPRRRARGYACALWAEAVVRSIGLSEFAYALTCYDRAIAIFADDGDELEPGDHANLKPLVIDQPGAA